MTYEKARAFIDQSNQYGSKLGLETITELLQRLGNPQDKIKIIHVAGTNGKGSTTAFLATILASAGYRVGRYISPAVFSYRERVQITTYEQEVLYNEYISKEGVSEAITLISSICEEMKRDGLAHPTSFEIETAMAMLYLFREQVDFAVVEVGLGGRLDATNVIKQPVCSVITSISMDHMQFLGDTIEKITAEKAGIIKKGAPVITSNTDEKVLRIIRQVCEAQSALITLATAEEIENIDYSPEGTTFSYQGQTYTLQLLGEHQISNAILAIETARQLKRLGYRVGEEAILNGLRNTKWGGRFELLRRQPYFIIDGAHNEDAALQLEKSIRHYFSGRRILLIMGVFADKDYKQILNIIAPLATVILTITPDNQRALASTQLAIEAKNYTTAKIIDAETAENAVDIAVRIAEKEDVIIAFGSLSILSSMKEALLSR